MEQKSECKLSRVASFDDLMRFVHAIFDFDVSENFKEFALNQEICRKEWLKAKSECQRLQKELEKSTLMVDDLNSKLFHARKLLDQEKKLRGKAEKELETLDRNICLARDLLFNDNRNKIADDTREKLAFLNHNTSRSHRLNTIAELNATGSVLSELSYSRSEDGLDDSFHRWTKHRASMPAEEPKAVKRRRSSTHKVVEIDANDCIVATTTLLVGKDGGPITATSIIESVPHIPEPAAASLDELVQNKYSSPSVHVTPSTDTASHYRQHSLVQRVTLRAENCGPCGKLVRFGKKTVRCRECRCVAHPECQSRLPLPCVPSTNTPSSRGNAYTVGDYAPSVAPMVPALVIHCVNEIETRGLNEVGLYRVPGSEKDVKILKEKFLHGKGIPNLESVETAVICGTVKDFLRFLQEPLITYLLWPKFMQSLNKPREDLTLSALCDVVSELPQPNRDTLAFLMLHLQKVAESKECKMPISNIARVFGPTIIGYSSSDLNPQDLYSETAKQIEVMECLLKIPSHYWSIYVNFESLVPTMTSELRQTPSTESINRGGFFTPMGRTISATRKKRRFFATPPTRK